MSRGSDAVVIGGGAAGVAAARMLHEAGRDVLLVEAKERLGGRAHTILHGGVAMDLGCGWLHSAKRNPWAVLASRYGLTVDRTPAHWREQWRDLGFAPAEQQAFAAASEAMSVRAHAMAAGPDRPLSDAVKRDDPWYPLLDAISGYANGAPLDEVSIHDWAAYEDASTMDNWAVVEGYGTLVARHAEGVPVALGTTVQRIDHRGRRLRIVTDRGAIETELAIVTLPTPILAARPELFDPPLPAKQAAAEALPLGLADKIFLSVDGPAFPANGHLLGNPHSAFTASYRLSPFGAPIVEAFLGSDCAEALECLDDGGAADFVIGELGKLLGSAWRFSPLARSRWRQDPLIGGSYSHARIGMAGQRVRLAAPVDEHLFFAGEACHRCDFSTAHGAFETGIAAAQTALARKVCA